MNGQAQPERPRGQDALERRYRWLLAAYPRAFRDEHEDELLAVLLAGAAAGQVRPSPAEAIDLVSNGILMRLSRMFERLFVTSYERRHPDLFWGVRIVWAVALIGLALVAVSSGSWLALLFLIGAAADIVLGYRIYRLARRRPPA